MSMDKTRGWMLLLVLLHTHEVRPVSELRCIRRLWKGRGGLRQAFHCNETEQHVQSQTRHSKKVKKTTKSTVYRSMVKHQEHNQSQRNQWSNERRQCHMHNMASPCCVVVYLLPACCVWRPPLPARRRYWSTFPSPVKSPPPLCRLQGS